MNFILFSDGSGNTNGNKPGSLGALIYPYKKEMDDIEHDTQIVVGGAKFNTTSQEMEIAAVAYGIRGFLQALKSWRISCDGVHLTIVTDSQYVYNAYNQSPFDPNQGLWMANWKTNGWKKSKGEAVKNQDMWKYLDGQLTRALASGIAVSWVWQEGHNSDNTLYARINNRVDAFCTKQAAMLISTGEQKAPWYQLQPGGKVESHPLLTPVLHFNKSEDLLESKAPVKVITVNKVGAMGKGIALDFASKYPGGLKAYKDMCFSGHFNTNRVSWWMNETAGNKELFLFAATKNHWRNPSQIEWIEECCHGIRNIWDRIGNKEGKYIAIPKMGCGNGGLYWEDVYPLILEGLKNIPLEVFE